MNGNKFLHISDLHFFESDHLKGRKDGIHHFEIKMRILEYISILITKEQIDAIFISGDLELGDCNILVPFLQEWSSLGCSIFIVFGEHDTQTARRELLKFKNHLNRVYIFNEAEVINDEALDFFVFGMSCEPKQTGFNKRFCELQKPMLEKPGVFLTHPNRLHRYKMREIGCSYYATGHIHTHHIEQVDQNTFLGRPGHLYSLWDGDGKAWPTGGIIGEFSQNHLGLTWNEFPVEQTIRLYIDPYHLENDRKLLYIENCSAIKKKELLQFIDGEWTNQGYRGIMKCQLDCDDNELRNLIARILSIFTGDIMVTPSDSGKMFKKYGYSRAVFHANSLLNSALMFDEYMERIIKATPKTQ